MPILVKSNGVRRGRKAKVRHGRLRAAQASMGSSSFVLRKPKFSQIDVFVICLPSKQGMPLIAKLLQWFKGIICFTNKEFYALPCLFYSYLELGELVIKICKVHLNR